MTGGTANRRFEMLDALRGVAAVIVMLHHVVPAMTHAQPFRSGYLAVDFFFMLSGLVIANAWEARLAGGVPLRTFARSRLARVYPVMAIGILAGVAVALLNGAHPRWAAIAGAKHLLFWPTFDGIGGVFPLDGVEWSLLFELFANALYALLLFRLPSRVLAAIVAAAAIMLLAVADPVSGIGLGDRPSTFVLGVPRVIATYTMGVLLFRLLGSGRAPRLALPAAAIPPLLVAALLAPGLAQGFVGPRFADPIVAILVFPAIILAACSVDASPRWRAAGQLGAALSFPIYAIHLPVLVWVIGPRVQAFGWNGAVIAVAITLALAMLMGSVTRPRPRRTLLTPLPA